MADLKLGLATGYWSSGPPAGAAEAIREAERLGFDSFWLTEHHFQHEGYETTPNLVLFGLHLAGTEEQPSATFVDTRGERARALSSPSAHRPPPELWSMRETGPVREPARKGRKASPSFLKIPSLVPTRNPLSPRERERTSTVS